MFRGAALGCMRLSSPEVDGAHAVAVIHAALDGGVRMLDTADVYAPSHDQVGHNEALVAHALQTWPGPSQHVEVVTKGGLVRSQRGWRPNATAVHLKRSAAASRERLGGGPLSLYLLHAPDPTTRLATSVRALAALKAGGEVKRVGLCNITATALEQAQAHVNVDAVQVAFSVFDDAAIRSGLLASCLQQGIPLLAHTPLGGVRGAARCARESVLVEIAEVLRTSPQHVALAYLWDVAANMVPLVGCTSVQHARELGSLRPLAFTAEQRTRLDQRFPTHASLRNVAAGHGATARPTRGSVVLIMGMPGAGKTRLAQALVEQGHLRLNRDEIGGRLAALIPLLDKAVAGGNTQIVMDNTYPARASRQRVVEVCNRHGVAAHCIWLTASLAEAQLNAALRQLERYGRLLDQAALATLQPPDPQAFLPGAQFAFQKLLEPPSENEGFQSVVEQPFVRVWPPDHTQRAVFVELDGIVRLSREGHRTPLKADDVEVPQLWRRALAAWHREGGHVVATSWLPELSTGQLSTKAAQAVEQRTRELLGIPLTMLHCPHPPGPPVCWCRKPLPGLAAVAITRLRLDPAVCQWVASAAADRTLAQRLGIPFVAPHVFVGPFVTSEAQG